MPKPPICKCSHDHGLHTPRGCTACRDCEQFDESYCLRCPHREASHDGDCEVPGCECVKFKQLTDHAEAQAYERMAQARRDRRRECERQAGWSEGAPRRAVFRRLGRDSQAKAGS